MTTGAMSERSHTYLNWARHRLMSGVPIVYRDATLRYERANGPQGRHFSWSLYDDPDYAGGVSRISSGDNTTVEDLASMLDAIDEELDQ